MTIFINAVDLLWLGLLGLVVLFFSAERILRWLQQRRCDHEKYFETMACEAVCTKCGKNLGFIGTVREERARK